MLELQYLYETKRVADRAEVVADDLRRRLDVGICDLPFSDVVRRSLALAWTRDPFDRLIVAQAAARESTLITKDRALRRRYPLSLW